MYARAPKAGLDPAILIAQAFHETGNFTSSWWVNRLNPAGIGITGDPAQDKASHTWENGSDSADSHIAHMTMYTKGVNDTGYFDPREDAYHDAFGNAVKARAISDLGSGIWATDPDYAEGIVGRGNEVYGDLPDATGGGTMSYSTNVPGVPGGPLITDYAIRQNLTAVDGYQRMGQKAGTPRRSIQHGTANASNPSAWQEAQYFVNGAEGRQASVHSFGDDNEIVIGVPMDEIAWQAADGNGPGNMNGFACEMMEATVIWQNATRRNRLIYICADFMGRCSARFGVTKPERHWDFNANSADRHHCPNKLMSISENGKTLWDGRYVPQWQKSRLDELARMKGGTEPKPTTPPTVKRTPLPKDGEDFWQGGFQYTLNAKQRRVLASDAAQYASPLLVNTNRASRTTLKKGKTVTLRYVVSGIDENEKPVLVFASTNGTHIRGNNVVAK
jgi:hypothetical protein